MEHDPECTVDPCICDIIARVEQRMLVEVTSGIWPMIRPIVDWIAGVNMVDFTRVNRNSD